MIEYGAIGLYWERCGIDKNCKSLLGTLKIHTVDVMVGYGSEDTYLGRFRKLRRCISLLGTL